LRHHDDFIDITNRLQTLKLVKDRKQLTFHEGINGLPALRHVGSLDFARSYPWDIMHLFFENIVPNLVKLWSGKFKHLDVGSEDYKIDSDVWDEIWAETVDAVAISLPSLCVPWPMHHVTSRLRRGASGLFIWRLFC
jgi:hypothetical protein